MWTRENTSEQLIKGIMKHGPDILEHCVTQDDISKYTNYIQQEFLNYPIPKKDTNKDHWFMPDEYRNMDIEAFLIQQCPIQNQPRLTLELEEYRKRNLLPLLKQMKYIVDTLRANNIVWGVGRGSSVASYALHILGVHRIDSIKYDIPLNEFFKGE
jgi:DNA polymerase III alpha subunit